ncbi:Zn-dependent hydrolase [Rhodanobacter sp. Root627]|uniref:dipeptidyl-peptidase 3 family protein n=1 Tax=Rhodanobacter sp. Root627 TaxID=1736572 RepID=UPI0006FBAA66|nr:Zn-dependent hydrolase [Rhodanobacter sp. Root627]KRA33427.1 Zn-dependent hydrolase [Rhodanobacter sp. Root627]
MYRRLLPLCLLLALAGCSSGHDAAPIAPVSKEELAPAPASSAPATAASAAAATAEEGSVAQRLASYAPVKLEADLSAFNKRQKKMIALLVEAADSMNAIYWRQSWGDKDALMSRITDPATREFAQLNYGPWDRLNNDKPFVGGIEERPPGAQFYPADMTREQFDQSPLKDKTSLYTLLRRDAQGQLITVPYHEAYKAELQKAAGLLREAAKLAQDAGFRKYLTLRADALLDDNYQPSDLAWMDMKKNPIDIVIGPIETYEDQLYGYKASYESYVLIKDQAWSAKLARFAKYLPELQRGLPVPDRYKAEKPGSDADLNAYFAVYYGGDANAGAKTIAINLPNDEQVQLKKGTRRLQLENVMKAKFDTIMLPIGKLLIADDQQQNLTFDAFFQNTMFHEVAHGLGIKQTLDGKGTVRKALKDQASSFEEGKADVLGLYMVTRLAGKGELDKTKLMDNYVTFLAGILRSVRFGASDAHARANMVRFNYFKQAGAFTRDDKTGRYRVDFDKMTAAMSSLSTKLLTIQGDGDYDAAKQLTDQLGAADAKLAGDLNRLAEANIPVDIRFEQGLDVLGLAKP